MLYGWKGNRRSGIALAMSHRRKWFIHLQAQAYIKEISTPPTLRTGQGALYLYSELRFFQTRFGVKEP